MANFKISCVHVQIEVWKLKAGVDSVQSPETNNNKINTLG